MHTYAHTHIHTYTHTHIHTHTQTLGATQDTPVPIFDARDGDKGGYWWLDSQVTAPCAKKKNKKNSHRMCYRSVLL